MKIRNGFVSNSSSSSFLIAVKGNTAQGNDDSFISKLDSLQESMESKLEGFPFVNIISSIFTTIRSNAQEFDIEERIADDWSGDSDGFWENNKNIKKLHDAGYKIYEVRVSNEDYEDMGQYLYEHLSSVNYESEDGKFIITTEYDLWE